MMVLLDAERKPKRRCCGLGSKVETAVLPDGGLTTEFQNWRISFGHSRPSWKGTKLLQGITKDSILADRAGGFVHSRLSEIVAPKTLFGPSYYFLEYQLPAAPFPVRVEVDDVDQLCRAYDQFATLPRKRYKKLVLKVIPRNPDEEASVFDERPPKTVKSTRLDTRAALTRYLVDLYTADKLKLATLNESMRMDIIQLRAEVYALLPDHEKEDHAYLIADRRATKPERMPLEQQYIEDQIDLQTYADRKDPERKMKRDKALCEYPLPERMYTCVICQRQACANIKCMECANRACQNCIVAKFVDGPDDRAFVLFHHICCLKLGDPTKVRKPKSRAKTERSTGACLSEGWKSSARSSSLPLRSTPLKL
ncbi:hypothetical protein CTAYLR_002367 [Chrysophaeum taylorii]|uniref:Uncharacterized protein n=1 Tax=Chrysophaeum taylorii TaxID=2483200 RepID=A0AAD7XN29_9STRA|nr:hypothetical protein CTAYLR_002367 [Chrysophaeum taylorii]